MRTEAGGNPSTHDGEVVMDLADIIASLQDLDDEELKLRGMSVEGTLDEMDDPSYLVPTAPRSTPGWRDTPTTSGCPGTNTRSPSDFCRSNC